MYRRSLTRVLSSILGVIGILVGMFGFLGYAVIMNDNFIWLMVASPVLMLAAAYGEWVEKNS